MLAAAKIIFSARVGWLRTLIAHLESLGVDPFDQIVVIHDQVVSSLLLQ